MSNEVDRIIEQQKSGGDACADAIAAVAAVTIVVVAMVFWLSGL